ncbi:hypothetical protein TRVL_08542 [Trypanosoma vivax]|nr:hypothetical protein TRVL_08542 [Trypanosoma vivax]
MVAWRTLLKNYEERSSCAEIINVVCGTAERSARICQQNKAHIRRWKAGYTGGMREMYNGQESLTTKFHSMFDEMMREYGECGWGETKSASLINHAPKLPTNSISVLREWRTNAVRLLDDCWEAKMVRGFHFAFPPGL